MQAPVTYNTGHPHNHVIRTITRRDPWRTAAVLTHGPSVNNRRRTCGGNFACSDRAGIVMKTNIGSLAGMVSNSRCASVNSSYICLSYRGSDASQIVAVDQIGIAIFP